MEHPTVLVLVEFPDPEFPTAGFLDDLAYPDAELIGFYHLDDDEAVEEARAEYEEEFTAELQTQAERFEQRGVRTEFDLKFDHDRLETRQRIAKRNKIDAILIPGGTHKLSRIRIAVRHTDDAEEKMATLLNIINRDALVSVDLIHIADPDDPEGEAKGESILKEMTSILTDKGIPSTRINREVQTGSDVSFLLQQAARNHDLIVLGETELDIGDKVFGPVNEYIADEADVPVLTVR